MYTPSLTHVLSLPPPPLSLTYPLPHISYLGPFDMRLDTTIPNHSHTHTLSSLLSHVPPLPPLMYPYLGPLDMRLDTTTPGAMTALDYLHSVKRNALKKALEVILLPPCLYVHPLILRPSKK